MTSSPVIASATWPTCRSCHPSPLGSRARDVSRSRRPRWRAGRPGSRSLTRCVRWSPTAGPMRLRCFITCCTCRGATSSSRTTVPLRSIGTTGEVDERLTAFARGGLLSDDLLGFDGGRAVDPRRLTRAGSSAASASRGSPCRRATCGSRSIRRRFTSALSRSWTARTASSRPGGRDAPVSRLPYWLESALDAARERQGEVECTPPAAGHLEVGEGEERWAARCRRPARTDVPAECDPGAGCRPGADPQPGCRVRGRVYDRGAAQPGRGRGPWTGRDPPTARTREPAVRARAAASMPSSGPEDVAGEALRKALGHPSDAISTGCRSRSPSDDVAAFADQVARTLVDLRRQPAGRSARGRGGAGSAPCTPAACSSPVDHPQCLVEHPRWAPP